MFTSVFYLSFILNLFIITATPTPAYIPTDKILLNCGSFSLTTSSDGRMWAGDVGTKFSPNNTEKISLAATATKLDPSVTEVPYLTARIIRSQFSYVFPVSPGKKFLRLYFYPDPYSGNLNITESSFTVTANDYTLLSNFRASLTIAAVKPPAASLIKEFIINVEQNNLLNVTFLPSTNSYAFINGIEVVSTPDNLYMDNSVKIVNFLNGAVEFDRSKTAMETLYRLNVGGQAVSEIDDTGMFRRWFSDDYFNWGTDQGNPLSNNNISVNYSQTPKYTAPAIVYTTARAMGIYSTRFNLSWIFPVDSGFFYLLRLHFCEINPDSVMEANQRVFKIFINNITAESEADVIYWAGGPGIPVFREYVAYFSNPPDGRRIKQDLFLALHPNLDVKPKYYDAILNGLEIFKLNNLDGSLAVTNPDPVVEPNTKQLEKKKKNRGKVLFAVIGGVAGGAFVILILGFLIFRRRRGWKDFDQKSSSKSACAPQPSDLCRRFLLEEIRSTTANFDANFVIGTGGFGNVYKGYIDNNLTAVAIKRLNPASSQGAHEFQTEIEMLSKLRHLHLVSLIGYCDEKGEMILIYDYMANGTLRDHLYRTQNPPLGWKQRLQICIGAAKGLDYLHSGTKHNIIHRDIKSTNILLDEKWVAKVSDFGLSKLGPSSGIHSHVSTQVKGSFGYLDPEYYKRQQLTDRSDVYSFGVVLFEVLCARPAIIVDVPTEEEVNLAEWAKRCYRKGTIDQIVDPNVKGEIAPECLMSFVETAIKCLNKKGIERLGMNDVVWRLEFALQLQEAAEKGEGDRPSPFFPLMQDGQRMSTEDDTDVGGDQECDAPMNNRGLTIASSPALSSDVFSDPTGR